MLNGTSYIKTINRKKLVTNLNIPVSTGQRSILDKILKKKVDSNGDIHFVGNEISVLKSFKLDFIVNLMSPYVRNPKEVKLQKSAVVNFKDEDGIQAATMKENEVTKWIAFQNSLVSLGEKFELINVQYFSY